MGMHGDSFWVMNIDNKGAASDDSSTWMYNRTTAPKRDMVNIFSDIRFRGPAAPKNGKFDTEKMVCSDVIIRFRARYPGIYPLHCHHTQHGYKGQRYLFKVVDAEGNLSPIPDGM